MQLLDDLTRARHTTTDYDLTLTQDEERAVQLLRDLTRVHHTINRLRPYPHTNAKHTLELKNVQCIYYTTGCIHRSLQDIGKHYRH